MDNDNLNFSSMEESQDGQLAGQENLAQAQQVPKFPMVSRSNLILGALFALAVCGIYLLHLKAGPAKASAAVQANDAKMDAFLQALQNIRQSYKDPMQRANSVVSTFYYEASQRQVPVKNLGSNPFAFEIPRVKPREPLESVPSSSVKQEDSETREFSQVMENVKKLTLQSVMTGGSAGATALISNNMLTVGQKIAGWTVIEIGPRQVVLKWKNETYLLKMQ